MSTTAKKAQLGFIGAGGFITCHHLLTAQQSDIIDIKAIADIDEARLVSHAAEMEIGYTTTDYRRLLDDPDVDIVVIGTKQDLHAQMIVEALNVGKWVFCEKPMAQTDEETAAVLAAEKDNPGKLAIGHNRRFAPAYARTKRLMQRVPRPWYINYRLMFPSPEKSEFSGFYRDQAKILYEGCHILDLVCWLLDATPTRVYMSGDRTKNNCCILEYPDASQVMFMCGSMGSWCLWKEYMEVFSRYHAITVSDFVDMRVRGFPGEYDQLFAPRLNERGEEVLTHGFDFYETVAVDRRLKRTDGYSPDACLREFDMTMEAVRRPVELPVEAVDAGPIAAHSNVINPDKGWGASLEHFVRCYLTGAEPQNADGPAGALTTRLALALLKSLETGQSVTLD